MFYFYQCWLQLKYENILLQEHFIAEDIDDKNDDQVLFWPFVIYSRFFMIFYWLT